MGANADPDDLSGHGRAGVSPDLNHVYAGRTDDCWLGFWLFAASMVVVVVG